MAKYISGAKLTVETPTQRYEFDAPGLAISSTTYGQTHDLCAEGLLNMVKTLLPAPKEAPVPPEEPKTAEAGPSHEQKQGLANVIIRAKQIERQQFMNARAIQAAALEAQKLMADATHKFHLAVLEGLHTGLTQEAIEKVLEDGGFGQLEEKIDVIQDLDTDLLYPNDL